MLTAVQTFVRVLARHWPLLLAWYFLGEAVHEVFMQLAAYAGAVSSLGGLLILPIAVLGRLVAYVAMFLTVRSALRNLTREDPEILATRSLRERVGEFANATLLAILPFLAFYTAWGLLDEDRFRFSQLALRALLRNEGLSSEFTDRIGTFEFGPLPIVVIAAALALRFVTTRFADRLPAWTAPVSVYAESVWVFLLFTFVSQQLSVVRGWLEGRAAVQWLTDFGDGVAANLPWVAGAWEWLMAALGLVGPGILLPLAWITVAGIIYGAGAHDDVRQSSAPRARGFIGGLRRFLGGIAQRVEELWDAVVFVLTAGPIPAGLYLVAFTLWAAFDRGLDIAALRVFGVHDTPFWTAWGGLIGMLAGAVSTPIMVALVAAAYDTVLGLDRRAERASEVQIEADRVGADGLADLQDEGPGGVIGHDEHRVNAVPAALLRTRRRVLRGPRRRP